MARVPLREEHADSLTRLFEKSQDYFELVQGAPPGPAEVQSAFSSLPEIKTYEDKIAFVILDDEDEVIGHHQVAEGFSFGQRWAELSEGQADWGATKPGSPVRTPGILFPKEPTVESAR